VQLTERGSAALARARAFHARSEVGLAQRIGPREAAAFRSVLTQPARVDESGATASAIRPM
jgi:hypothetical protein